MATLDTDAIGRDRVRSMPGRLYASLMVLRDDRRVLAGSVLRFMSYSPAAHERDW